MSIQLEQAKQKAGKIARKTLWIILAASLISAIGYYFYRTYEVSDGTRVGMLFKISRKGIMFKTFEGQLHLGGSAVISTQSTWDFSVKNATVYEDLQKLEGKMIKCYYSQKVDPFPWQGDTEYIVYKAEIVQ